MIGDLSERNKKTKKRIAGGKRVKESKKSLQKWQELQAKRDVMEIEIGLPVPEETKPSNPGLDDFLAPFEEWNYLITCSRSTNEFNILSRARSRKLTILVPPTLSITTIDADIAKKNMICRVTLNSKEFYLAILIREHVHFGLSNKCKQVINSRASFAATFPLDDTDKLTLESNVWREIASPKIENQLRQHCGQFHARWSIPSRVSSIGHKGDTWTRSNVYGTTEWHRIIDTPFSVWTIDQLTM